MLDGHVGTQHKGISLFLHPQTMSYNRPTQAPKGYIPGLGRGAAGFVTASDVSSLFMLHILCATFAKPIHIFFSLCITDWPSSSPHHHRRRLHPRRLSLSRTPCRQTRRSKATTKGTAVRTGSRRICRGSRTGCLHLRRGGGWTRGRRGRCHNGIFVV